jgi:hypothetical protein
MSCFSTDSTGTGERRSNFVVFSFNSYRLDSKDGEGWRGMERDGKGWIGMERYGEERQARDAPHLSTNHPDILEALAVAASSHRCLPTEGEEG